MTFLILGAYHSVNLGDAVICECVAEQLYRHFPTANFLIRDVIRRDRTVVGPEPKIKTLERRRIRERIRRISTCCGIDLVLRHERRRVEANREHIEAICSMDCDVVIFAGGKLFMDRYALFLEAYVDRFAARGIPVLFNACGVGPSHSRAIRRQLRKTLNMPNVKHISCRDNVNLVNERYMKQGKAVLDTFDPALGAQNAYKMSELELTGTVGLGVLYPGEINPRRMIRFWQGVVRSLNRQGIKWKFFTNGDQADIAFARQVLSSMPETAGRDDELIVPHDSRPEALVRTVAQFRSLISFRLHSHIVAASLNIPSVAIVWSEKLPFFFEKIGHRERCLSVNDTPETVLSALARAEAEGYDQNRIRKQVEFAENLLIGAVKKVISENQYTCAEGEACAENKPVLGAEPDAAKAQGGAR